MFDLIAGRYDLLNRILSLGIDRRWRRRLVRALALAPGHRVLDLATGTADVALEVVRQEPAARVIGLDPSARMLAVGRDKAAAAVARRRIPDGAIELRPGVAERLPFADGAFDALSIAFGIRNVDDRAAALREMARVVRAGGRIAILELTEPRAGLIAPLARFHIHTLVPTLGAWLSGKREYAYLERSIARFPAPETFAAQMAENGHEVLAVDSLTFGAACLFVSRPAVVRPAEAPPEPV